MKLVLEIHEITDAVIEYVNRKYAPLKVQMSDDDMTNPRDLSFFNGDGSLDDLTAETEIADPEAASK